MLTTSIVCLLLLAAMYIVSPVKKGQEGLFAFVKVLVLILVGIPLSYLVSLLF